jgi:hypothetical protein
LGPFGHSWAGLVTGIVTPGVQSVDNGGRPEPGSELCPAIPVMPGPMEGI